MSPATHSSNAILLSATLLDMSLFGMVAQQFYAYWTSGFRDPIYLKLFVNVQFVLVAFQSVLMCNLMFDVFVNFPGEMSPHSILWTGPVNSLCQILIILLANMFLGSRIYGLTKSRIQSLTPVALSIIAFVFGIVTIVTTAWSPHSQSFRYATSVVWYTSQATAEFLITCFLARALLKSRSGVCRSDKMLRYLARNVIQTGVLATIWAISALVSWFWLKHLFVYRVFDITSGTVYMLAIFETLISRTQLRGLLHIPKDPSSFAALDYSTEVQWYMDSHQVWPNLIVDRHIRSHKRPGGILALWTLLLQHLATPTSSLELEQASRTRMAS
ncbi:hypothetical protein DFH94DRAFT_758395 [Russula ochroleuca]|uniref:Uncharacterized protein n=1 Tax=Russula ochroleuca TaxID=152965 RepID=A0A9P5MRU3_9AGAM|nr:hypothetical protein DFH94DRAFT_758395 [Russula ochroleuca]